MTIWWCNTIRFASKFKLYESLVTSILFYGCETWTLHYKKESRLSKPSTRRNFSVVWAGHTLRQPLKNHPSRHLRGWAMLWSAEEMLDGQHQRLDILAHARTVHKGLLQKRLEDDLC